MKRYLDKVKIIQKVLVVREDGKFLVVRRSKEAPRRPECWDFPGGNFEKGENIVKSAKREVREEVGLEVGELKPIYLQSSGKDSVEDLDVISVGYVTSEFEGEIVLSHEHIEYRWVSAEEFVEMEVGDDGGFLKKCVEVWKK